jgi:hypothetical protein
MYSTKLTTTKTTNFILGILSIVFILLSCETDDFTSEPTQTSFTVSEIISVDEDVILSAQTDGNFDALEWTISDGNSYYEPEVSHQFAKPGNYTIQLKTYSNGIETSSAIKSTTVYFTHKFLELEFPVYTKEVLYVENKIIISAVKQVSNSQLQIPEYKSTFFLLDNKLNLISEIENLEEISNKLNSFLSLGDSILAFNSSFSEGLSYYNFKSAGPIDAKSVQSNSLLNYNKGFVYLRNEGNTGFHVDFFNESLEKIWTKTFADNNTTNSRYFFNINNRLYYLSFDKQLDKAYIKKFKNQSVTFNDNQFSLKTSVQNREELFALNNPVTNTITFAIYSKESSKTSFYSIKEDCSFELIKEVDGRFDSYPQFCTFNGSYVTTNNNRIAKYNSNWEIIAEKELVNSNFNISQLSDNLYLLCENLPSGKISLSFVDKHLSTVFFE